MPVTQLQNYSSQELAYSCASKLIPEPIKEFAIIGKGNNNRFAYKVLAGDKTYKMYEALSAGRAKEIAQITNFLSDHNINIPKCLCTFDKYILAEWIDGDRLSFKNTEHVQQAARYQAQIHGQALTDRWHVTEFKHLTWLIDYFIKVASKFYKQKRLVRITDSILRLKPPSLLPRIANPDFICSNLVIDKDANIYIIDNEFLYKSVGFEYDIYNIMRVSLKEDNLVDQYLAEYERVAPLHTFYQNTEYWTLCYDLKQIRKKLIKERIDTADDILRTLEEKLASREVLKPRT